MRYTTARSVNRVQSTGKFLLLVCLTSFLNPSPVTAQTILQDRPPAPNIIFLLTDDHRWDALGAAGNPIIRTPHLDKLATAGILFRNAYVTTSICCVSRASLLTGQYESRHRIHNFTTDLSPAALKSTYPALLRQAGYTLGFVGKFGVGKNPPDSLYDFWVNTEKGSTGGQPDYIRTDKNGYSIHDNDTINNAVQQFLRQYYKNTPFCLAVSFKAPHEQDGNPPTYITQPRFNDYYKDVHIPEPVTADPIYWDQLPPFLRTDNNIARERWKGLLSPATLYQENVKNYYRLISGVDEVVGNLMTTLERSGLADNTVIIFMGDNGFLLGEHGMEGKWYGYDPSIRVPLFIYYPRLPDRVRQTRPGQIALNIDIAPTILSMAGVPVPAAMQGQDLLAVLDNRVTEREYFFYQHYFLGSPKIPRVEGVVSRDFKYMQYIEHDYEELFDRKHDPHETLNLSADPRYRKKLNELRRQYKKLKAAAQ